MSSCVLFLSPPPTQGEVTPAGLTTRPLLIYLPDFHPGLSTCVSSLDSGRHLLLVSLFLLGPHSQFYSRSRAVLLAWMSVLASLLRTFSCSSLRVKPTPTSPGLASHPLLTPSASLHASLRHFVLAVLSAWNPLLRASAGPDTLPHCLQVSVQTLPPQWTSLTTVLKTLALPLSLIFILPTFHCVTYRQ